MKYVVNFFIGGLENILNKNMCATAPLSSTKKNKTEKDISKSEDISHSESEDISESEDKEDAIELPTLRNVIQLVTSAISYNISNWYYRFVGKSPTSEAGSSSEAGSCEADSNEEEMEVPDEIYESKQNRSLNNFKNFFVIMNNH